MWEKVCKLYSECSDDADKQKVDFGSDNKEIHSQITFETSDYYNEILELPHSLSLAAISPLLASYICSLIDDDDSIP